jgi:hypothetical protein
MKSDSNADHNLKKFTKNISSLYEQNSNYLFEGDQNCFVKVRDNPHMKELALSPEFLTFRREFNLSHFNKISPLLFSQMNFKVRAEDGGWNLVTR